MSDATGAGGGDDLPKRRVTFNMLVGYNVGFYRRALGETQAEFGAAMGGWSPASVSAAERSWEGRRVRKFDCDELARIADHFGLPVIAMLLPPSDAGVAADYTVDFGGSEPRTLQDLLPLLTSEYRGRETPPMAAYRDRLIALAGSFNTDHPVAIQALTDARRAVDAMFIRARRSAEQVTSDARARAESLERDAQERHRAAMHSLIESRQELERRVHDLRAFEREYRSRMLAYFEGMIRELQAGVPDSGVFPAVGGDQDREDMRPVPPGGES